ncbi:MAG: SUMF1/EgtB/PvdO family nonheme iron enzyme [Hyphomicrobiaceae bacterium]
MLVGLSGSPSAATAEVAIQPTQDLPSRLNAARDEPRKFASAPDKQNSDFVTLAFGTGRETGTLVAGAGEEFTDCPDGCPAMVVVPAASNGATIGSPEHEPARQPDEKQQTFQVRAFAIGKFEVTVAEYLLCVEAEGCAPPEWLQPGGQHNVETGSSRYYKNLGTSITGLSQPVVGVGHSDALAYATWLSAKTGKPYRLPSEIEWEYAARGGTATAYWWGNDVRESGNVWANCRGCGSEWDAKLLAPANSLAPNPWGLHHVLGNVWEWVSDVYCERYSDKPVDGTAHLDETCYTGDSPKGLRVLRGGSAFYEPSLMRVAIRLRNRADFKNVSVGFRIARSIDQ